MGSMLGSPVYGIPVYWGFWSTLNDALAVLSGLSPHRQNEGFVLVLIVRLFLGGFRSGYDHSY